MLQTRPSHPPHPTHTHTHFFTWRKTQRFPSATWSETNVSWSCQRWRIDSLKSEQFVLTRPITWPGQESGSKVEKWYKLGHAMYMFTGGLSHQIKPEAHQWFTSRHCVVRVSRPTLNTINDWPSHLAGEGPFSAYWSACLWSCHAPKPLLPSKNKWRLI